MGAKIGIAVIALWSMVQSTLYTVLAGASYAVQKCHLSLAGTRFNHILYVWYFRDSECEPINWSVLLGREVGLNAEPIVPSVSGDVVFRLSIISYVFFAINLLWLIASILLLVALCTICCRRSLVNTWIGISVLVVLADFGASGIFVWDLVYTYPVDQFLNHFQLTVPLNEPFDIARPLVALPSIIMLLTSSRILVFWILNIVLIFIVARLARTLYKQSDDDLSSIDSLHRDQNQNNNQYLRSPKPDNSHQMQEIVRDEHNDSYVETVTVSNNYAGNKLAATQQGFRYDDQAPRATSPPHYGRAALKMAEPQSPRNYVEHRYFEPLKTAPSPTPSPDPTHKVPFMPSGLLDQQRITIDRPHLRSSSGQSRPAVPPKPNRDSSVSPNPDTARNSNQIAAAAPPPEELRGQLPWSYFKSPSDITGPKRTFTHLRDDEDLPAVPVPDYTLHFPRKDRPVANSSEDNGVWSGPEQRY